MGSSSQSGSARWLSWASTLLTVVLLIWGIYYLLEKISLADIGQAFSQVRLLFLGLSALSIMLTFFLKAWRWQLLLSSQTKTVPLAPLFWSMMLGMYVNNMLPFVRLGEIARIYALNYQTGTGKIQSLSTLFVEKVLEVVMLGLTIIVLLPFFILPEIIQQTHPVFWLGGVGIMALLVLYVLAYQSEWVLQKVRQVSQFLPSVVSRRLPQIAASGLEGLKTLREQRLTLIILGSSILIAFAYVLSPYFLFPAFGIRLGLAEATIIHVAVSLALAPPSTPGKIGVLDGVVAFLLVWFGLKDETAVAAYTIVFHLVIILPQIIFGSIAASRTQWRWQDTAVSQPPKS